MEAVSITLVWQTYNKDVAATYKSCRCFYSGPGWDGDEATLYSKIAWPQNISEQERKKNEQWAPASMGPMLCQPSSTSSSPGQGWWGGRSTWGTSSWVGKMSVRLTAKLLQAGLEFSSGLLNILLVSQGILLKWDFDAKSFDILTGYKIQSSRELAVSAFWVLVW